MNNLEYMSLALLEADIANSLDEVPVGAIVVMDGKVIGKGHNSRIEDNKISSHAEINAIQDAEKTLGRINLEGASIYVTLEPCPTRRTLSGITAYRRRAVNTVWCSTRTRRNTTVIPASKKVNYTRP